MSMWIVAAAIAFAVASIIYAWMLQRHDRARAAARVRALSAAIDGTAAADIPPRAAMFDRDASTVVHGRPLLKVAAGFGMAVTIIVLIAMTGDRHAAPVSAGAPATARVQGEALELLSMRHEREGDTLTVTGLVRNPAAAPHDGIIAVVFAFDRDGDFIASGRAPLEFAPIAAGDESPFRVTVPDVQDVGRYRVSFRTDGGVVRHVDLRDGPAASALRRAQASLQ